MGLAGHAARGTTVTLLGQLTKFAIQAASIVVLSRLLTPSEFGLFTMISAITALAAVLGDFGLSYAAIQAPTLTQGQKSNLFWINTGLGIAGTVAMFSASPLIAMFYGAPDLVPISQAMSASFVLLALAVQSRAQLSRDLKFRALAVSDVGGQVFGFAIALALVALGAGVWALVAQQLSAYLFQLLYSAVASGWSPGLPRRGERVGALLRFGGHTVGGGVINYASTNVDKIALGRTASSEDVGIYGRMFQLFSLPLQQLASPLTRVAIPTLSRLIGDPRRYMAFLVRAQTCMAYVFSAFFAYLFACASSIVPLALGEGWEGGIGLLQVLCIGGLFQGLGYCYYWVFLSQARMDVQLWLGMVTRSVTIVAVVAVSPLGTYAVAIAATGGLLLNWLVYASIGMRKVGISGSALLRVAWRPALLAIGFGLLGAATTPPLEVGLGHFGAMLVVAAVGSAYYGAIALIVPPVRRDLSLIFSTLRMGLTRGGLS